MNDAYERFTSLPGRFLLDTCILDTLYEEGEYIFEGFIPEEQSQVNIDPDIQALHKIFQINERSMFQLVVSPLTIAEVANIQDFSERERKLRWVLDVLDHWLVMLDEIGDRIGGGGNVRHRFKLTKKLQQFETQLMEIADFRKDPFDRLLLIQYQMGNCDAFLTKDVYTIWKHRKKLSNYGIHILTPSETWNMLKPWANLWR